MYRKQDSYAGITQIRLKGRQLAVALSARCSPSSPIIRLLTSFRHSYDRHAPQLLCLFSTNIPAATKVAWVAVWYR